MDTSKLDRHQRQLRMNIRNFFMVATRAELKAALPNGAGMVQRRNRPPMGSQRLPELSDTACSSVRRGEQLAPSPSTGENDMATMTQNVMAIQAPAPFHDGTFVLHKINVNGHKYSAWFGKDGVVFSAERFSSDNQKTFNVPLNKQKNVAAELTKIGKRYVGRSVPGVQMFALKAEYQRGGTYEIIVKEGSNVEPLGELGFVVFTDPAKLLADMESGKVMLNMRFEKRNAIMDHLRTMTPPVVV